ncbi:MAG: Lrp/AsnC ligand binding domain-containing protein [Nitrososphaerales archaeon]
MSQVQGVKNVNGTYGVYDIIAEVEVSDMNALEQVVTTKIRRIPSINSTETLIAVDFYSSEPYYDKG